MIDYNFNTSDYSECLLKDYFILFTNYVNLLNFKGIYYFLSFFTFIRNFFFEGTTNLFLPINL